MTERIVTYHSENAEQSRQWIAYVDTGHDYLGIRFEGYTEGEARTKAEEFWEKDRAEREANIKSREEGRKKAAETRARKKEASE